MKRVFFPKTQLLNRLTGNELAQYGLSGITYSALLDSVGIWHNEYQESSLNFLLQSNINLLDTSETRKILFDHSKQFFALKGMNFEEYHLDNLKLGIPFNSTFELVNPLSLDAKKILHELQLLVNNFQVYDSNFIKSLEELRNSALHLSDEVEVVSVGIPISIAQYSYYYWNSKGDFWVNRLKAHENINGNEQIDTRNNIELFASKKCDINLYKLGGADVVGAIGGAVGGAILGPGGAIAGGVLNSAVASLGNLTNQVIDCHVSWWPF